MSMNEAEKFSLPQNTCSCLTEFLGQPLHLLEEVNNEAVQGLALTPVDGNGIG